MPTVPRPARRLLACALLLAPACLTPPAVAPAGDGELRLLDFPPGTERVELPVAESAVLRGVFLPAGEGAPVLVHFPAMFESITWGAAFDASLSVDDEGWIVAEQRLGAMQITRRVMPLASLDAEAAPFPDLPLGHALLLELRRAGCAVLVVDYAGVGASTGTRSPRHLARDARAILAEALRRADGDAGRVILRGVSLGTLAVAALLEGGAQPGAVELIAPVRDDTVVGHFARLRHGAFLGTLAAWFHRPVGSTDMQTRVERLDVPARVVLPERDALLPAPERDWLALAAETRGAELATFGVIHEHLALAARALLPGELAFLDRALPQLPAARARRAEAALQRLRANPLVAGKLAAANDAQRARLAALLHGGHWPDPRLALALALRDDGAALAETLRPWIEWQPAEPLATLPWNALEALVSFHDPVLPLDPAWVAELAPHGPALRASEAGLGTPDGLARRFLADDWQDITWSVSVGGDVARASTPDSSAIAAVTQRTWTALASRDPAARPDLGAHLALRLALRTACLPDRVRTAPDGGALHEVWWEGGWVDVERWRP